MRLLLVEDDAMIGESIEEELREQGYAVDWVHDGAAAELALQTQDYDLMLLDLGLPRKQGLEVLTDYRGRGGETPVLIITAQDAIDDRVRGLDAFCSPWLILWVLLLHGWALKATLALVQDGPGGVREAVLMGGPPGLLLDGILLGGIGLAALAAGWAVAGPLLSRRRARPHRSILARLDVRRWSDWNIRRRSTIRSRTTGKFASGATSMVSP